MTITSSLLDSGPFAWSVAVSADHSRCSLATDLSEAIAALPTRLDGGRTVQVWIEDVQDGDDELVAGDVRPYRDLLQLRRTLPADPSGIETRAFDPERDVDEFIETNNRAFEWHPEQAGLTRERLAATMSESWFNPEGFRIFELEDRMAGFCWTKVHAEHLPVLGEIYVIAIDPHFHGRGLGGPMTLAGLEWLSAQGISEANLYVESDNHAAIRTYDRLGFSRYSINRAYTSDPS